MNTMANIETSFIPEQGGSYQYGARRSYAATILAVIITLIAIGGTVYAWWAQRVEAKKVDDLGAQLQSTEKNFDLAKIGVLAQLDNRINLARDMFNKHSMPSLVIDYLSDHTVSSIVWKQFTYQKMVPGAKATAEGEPAGDSLEISGEANGYAALYQQLTHFRQQRDIILSTNLESFHIDPRTGIVSIQIKLILRPTYATFATERALNAAQQSAPTPDLTIPTPTPVTPSPVITPPVVPATTTVPVVPIVPTVPATKTTAKPQAPATSTKAAPITPAVTPVGQ